MIQQSIVRFAHFSDIHVTVRRYKWRREDWLNKRLAAWFNHRLLGRGYRFRKAETVLQALQNEFAERQMDHLLFSGDATAMGFAEEVERAAALLRVGEHAGLAVPGNHDYCTKSAMESGCFERCFAAWQEGERIEGHTYPFAQKVGHAWLVAVNSATANRWAWDASGRVGDAQLARLRALLARLDGGPRILVTHYPVARSSGLSESKSRRLNDLGELLLIAEEGGVGLWLHGHRHDSYYHATKDVAAFPVVCAGSATQVGHWSYGEYELVGTHLTARQRVYEATSGGFRDGESFEVDLPQ